MTNNNNDPFNPADWRHIADAIEQKKAEARQRGCGCCVVGNKLRFYCERHAPVLLDEDLRSLFPSMP